MSFLRKLFRPDKPTYKTEKRRGKRVRVGDDFSMKFYHKPTKKTDFASPRDLSVVGVRFVTRSPIEMGDELTIYFYFSRMFTGTKTLELDARVVRVYRPRGAQRNRVGAELLHKDEASRETLREFLEWVKS